jgi:hypothetical protein
LVSENFRLIPCLGDQESGCFPLVLDRTPPGLRGDVEAVPVIWWSANLAADRIFYPSYSVSAGMIDAHSAPAVVPPRALKGDIARVRYNSEIAMQIMGYN